MLFLKRKMVSALTLTLLLIGMLTLAFNIRSVKASGTIYIRADGSIEPDTAPILSLDKITYTFTDSIYDQIVVERNNIVIDGNGYTLQGTGAYASKGVDLSSRSNITSKNTNIKDFSYGILLSESSNISITGNNITNNNWGGIGLWGASNNTISGNHITNNSGIGIMLTGLFGSSNNRVIGNVLVNDGLSVWNSYGNVVVDNLVNGKPLVYLEGVSDVVVEDAGQVILVNCNRIKVENLNLSNTYIGVQLWQTNNATISGNNITNNSYGIRLDDSSNCNSISGNNITANNEDGIRLTLGTHSKYNSIVGNYIINNRYGIESGAENSISGNTITNNSIGIFLDSSYYSIIVGNQITNNSDGISLGSWSNYNSISGNNITANNGYGIWVKDSSSNNVSGNTITANNYAGIKFYSSSYNSISGNHITNNWDGIELWGSSYDSVVGNNITANINHGILLYISSNNNAIFGNNITANKDGIFLGYSPNYNSIYHNTFIDNARQVYDFSWEGFGEPSINVWDNGYPSGGNYWSNYTGADSNHDGIGDTAYIIDANNTDRYPLMNPYGSARATAATVDIDPDVLNLKGKLKWVNAYIELPEGYNVSDVDVSILRLNMTIPAELEPTAIGDYDNDTIPDLMVEFNRTAVSELALSKGIMYGNATLTVTGKLYNGRLFEGFCIIKVRMPGDINSDGKIDAKDVALVSFAFGSYPGHPRWKPLADENEDGKIDVRDVSLVARNFGKTYT